MREASNLRMLEKGQTPLLGGENPMLAEGGAGTGIGLAGEAGAAAAAAAAASCVSYDSVDDVCTIGNVASVEIIADKDVIIATNDDDGSVYMGTNVNGNINSAADNGFKVDKTDGAQLKIPVSGTGNGAKIVAENVVVAGTVSSYMGTNQNGNINANSGNGLKVDAADAKDCS